MVHDINEQQPPSKILRIEITRDGEKKMVFLSQHKYLEKVMIKFGKGDAKAVWTPL